MIIIIIIIIIMIIIIIIIIIIIKALLRSIHRMALHQSKLTKLIYVKKLTIHDDNIQLIIIIQSIWN